MGINHLYAAEPQLRGQQRAGQRRAHDEINRIFFVRSAKRMEELC